ncbi:MAG: hypothetical protein R2991_10870 [Thermoanaerobaculia bacterium]
MRLKHSPSAVSVFACALALAIVLPLPAAAGQVGVPTFSKAFVPSTIGAGSSTTLRFTIANDPSTPLSDLAFTDTLPAGVVIADPSQAVTECGGTLTAPAGGDTITFTDGVLGGGASCTVIVDVTSALIGSHDNVSGDLTSSAGNSGPAIATLTVDSDRPGFLKAFSPASVPLGARSTLTFTIDNTHTEVSALNLQFTDTLPPSLVVADPPNLTTTCGGAPTAAPGSDLISLPFSSTLIFGGSTCEIGVDVVATGAGSLGNTSGELQSNSGSTGQNRSSGRASATLDVTVDPLHLIKSFVDDPAAPGGTTTLRFTVLNLDRELGVTGIAFTDDLDATLSGLVAVAPLPTEPCGAGSTLTGTSLLTLAGGSLPPEGSCVFDVTLQVPAGASTGAYPNTTSSISGLLDGSPVMGGPATETLYVAPVPLLTKEFTDDPVGAGGTVNLEFTVTNQSTDDSATDIAFSDALAAIVVSAALPSSGFCGGGSAISFTPGSEFTQPTITVSGGNLPAGGSCTFSVDLTIAPGSPGGLYPNTTSPITATVSGETLIGSPASDVLTVVTSPVLTKTFIDDPVDPGGTATLELTLSLDENATGDATAITFADDLDATLSGLTALGLPLMDFCGMGSTLSGTSTLTFTGGTLAPGESCTVQVTLSVPSDALPGPHTNTTSAVAATVSGVPTTGRSASDDLSVSGLELTKEFTDDPVVPGGTVTLELTLENVSPVADATAIAFSDDLAPVLSGLTATGLPMMDVCGMGSSLTGASGNTRIVFGGGSLPSGASCTFSVTLQVPMAATSGIYDNATSNVSATMGGVPNLLFPPATDALTVSSDLLSATKSFTDDPAAPGGTVTLELTLTNLHPSLDVTGIALTDDLNAVVPGLAAVGLPMMDVCGMGSSLTGTSVISLTGGTLAPLSSCTFSVTLAVPASVPLGASFLNTTSTVTGSLAGLGVTGQPATDTLFIDSVELSKAFAGPVAAGGTVTLTFTLDNLDAANGIAQLSFTDDLDAVLPGLVAVGLPASNVCGAGSSLTGTSFLTLTDGSLAAGGSCSFPVQLQVPAAATPGSYPNVTSEVFSGGLSVGSAATDTLSVEPPPTFAKAFAPSAILAGDVSTLTFTIDNSASALAASALSFTDNLPAGLVVATPNGASTTCTGGTIGATPGSGVVSYSGGSVGAGASCTVQADVTGTTAGDYLNVSGDLTSSSGNSGTASDTLTILDVTPPTVTNVDSILGTDGSIDECDSVRTTVAALLVTFSESMYDPGDPMDPNAVTNPDNWMLVGAGPDHDLSTLQCGPLMGDDVATAFGAISWNPGSLTATLVAAGPGPVADAPYRLMACSGGLVDDGGANPLDGDGDGTGGDDFVRGFRIDRFDALDDGHFDCDLDAWTVDTPPGTEILFSSDDVDDAGISGSVAFTAQLPAISATLAQCAPILPESIYHLSGFVRLDSSQPRRFLTACDTFASMDCSGSPLFTTQSEVLVGAPGAWTPFTADSVLMPGVHSALCRGTVLPGNEAPYSVHLDDVSFDAVFTQILFQDGFESGDTSAWTTTTP